MVPHHKNSPAHLIRQMQGGVVNDPGLALAIARLLLAHHYSTEDLARSEPLTMVDEDTIWKIEGTQFRDEKKEGLMSAIVKIEKDDGRVAELIFNYVPDLPPEVKEQLIAAHNRSKSQ